MYYVICDPIGGLGNQLFQIFTVLAYAIRHKKKPAILDSTVLRADRPFYWDNLLSSLVPLLIKKQQNGAIAVHEPRFQYQPIPEYSNSDIILKGYFQSYKYFSNEYSDILNKYLAFPKPILTKAENVLASITNNSTDVVISMHFRWGDYCGLPDYHNVLDETYYLNATQIIRQNLKHNNIKYVAFCEKTDKEQILMRYKTLFKQNNIIFIDEPLVDYEELMVMSKCTHNIIANSSFSWFGAFFNTNPNKIVIYPNQWFGPKLSHNNICWLCPPDWISAHSNVKNCIIDHIFFINLDYRIDRRSQIENQISSVLPDIPSERFSAIHEPPPMGIWGCGMSHLSVLKLAKERGYQSVLILEDDFIFTTNKSDVNHFLTRIGAIEFDVCMISHNIINSNFVPINENIVQIKEAQTASGYIVKSHYYDKLIFLYETAMPLLKSTKQHWIYANDQIWKSLQKKDYWIGYLPPLGKQSSGFSDNSGTFCDYNC